MINDSKDGNTNENDDASNDKSLDYHGDNGNDYNDDDDNYYDFNMNDNRKEIVVIAPMMIMTVI